MEGNDRYPPPDPADPFAPLWVLRSKNASVGGRPSTAGGRASSPDASRPSYSSSFALPSPTLTASPDDRWSGQWSQDRLSSPALSCKVLQPSSPESRPHCRRSQSFQQPILAFSSSFNATGSRNQHKQPPEVGSKDLANETAFKRNSPKISKLFLGSKRPSTSPSLKESMNFITRPRHRTNSLRATAGPIPRHQNHYRLSKSHQRASSSYAKPAISPPVISTALWESPVTGRQFVPIAASPIFNNAFPVQQQTVVVTDPPALDTLTNDDASAKSFRHGRSTRSDAVGRAVVHIKSPRSSPLSPHFTPRSNFEMHDDSGVEMNDLQREPIVSESLESTSALPPTSRKREASSHLAPITTITRSSSSSSYIEIFSTPGASPIDLEAPVGVVKEVEAQILVTSTPPMSPLASLTPQDHTPHSAFAMPPRPPTATSDTNCSPLESASTTKVQCLCSSNIPASQPPQAEWAMPTKNQLAFAASLPIYQNDGTSIPFGTLFAEHRTIVLFLRHFFCPLCQDYVSSLASLVKQPILKETGALCPFDEVDARVSTNEEGQEGLSPKQVQLVLISCGKASLVDKYKDMFELPFRMFTDPDTKVYEALGMGKERASPGDKMGTVPITSLHGAAKKEVGEKGDVRPPVLSTMSEKDLSGRNGGYVKHGLMGGIAMVVMRALKAGMPVWEKGGDIAQLGGEFVLGPGLTCAFAHRMQDPKGHAPVLDVLAAANVNIPDEILRSSSRTTGDLVSPSDHRVVAATSEEGLLKKRKARSASISGLSPRNLLSPLSSLHSLSLNGHGNAIPMNRSLGSVGSTNVSYETQSVDGHGVLQNRQRRESFVTATIRSMGGKVPPGFKNLPYNASHDTLGSGVTSSDYHYHRAGVSNPDRDFRPYPCPPRPSSSRSHVEQEQTWMEHRQRDLETLRQRKDARRRTGRALVSGADIETRSHGSSTPVFYHYPDDPSLSTMEFGAGSVKAGKSQSLAHYTPSQYSTNAAPKSEVVSTPSLQQASASDLSHDGGVVSVGGFIQAMPRTNKQKPAAHTLVHIKPGAAKVSRSRSFSASVRNFMRGG